MKALPQDKSLNFLNVDLEIMSTVRLAPLTAAMGQRVLVLYCGPFEGKQLLVLETLRSHKGPNETIHALCTLVEQLPPETRRLWNRAKRDFDVGYDMLPSERSSRFTLRSDTLKRVAQLGATLTVTYYNRRADNKRSSQTVPRKRLRGRS